MTIENMATKLLKGFLKPKGSDHTFVYYWGEDENGCVHGYVSWSVVEIKAELDRRLKEEKVISWNTHPDDFPEKGALVIRWGTEDVDRIEPGRIVEVETGSSVKRITLDSGREIQLCRHDCPTMTVKLEGEL